eukprot:gene13777-4029_t
MPEKLLVAADSEEDEDSFATCDEDNSFQDATPPVQKQTTLKKIPPQGPLRRRSSRSNSRSSLPPAPTTAPTPAASVPPATRPTLTHVQQPTSRPQSPNLPQPVQPASQSQPPPPSVMLELKLMPKKLEWLGNGWSQGAWHHQQFFSRPVSIAGWMRLRTAETKGVFKARWFELRGSTLYHFSNNVELHPDCRPGGAYSLQ